MTTGNISIASLPTCPADCPFLGTRSFIPNTIPFYCNKYETFLGVLPPDKPFKCAQCTGLVIKTAQYGCSLIDAYTVDAYTIEETKRLFLKLNPVFQKMFVNIVSQTGVQIVLTPDDAKTPENLTDKILTTWKRAKDLIGSPQMKEFKSLLDSDGMPLMTRATQNLLMNLFMVMDSSEQDMLQNIMKNPALVDSFLNNFAKQPQDHDLLKNVRALVYDYDRQREAQLDRQRQRHQERQIELQRQRQYEQQKLRQLQRDQLQQRRQKFRELTR